MSVADPIKLGLVGCGGISQAHAKAAQNSSGKVRFTACCDIRLDAAQSWAETHGCPHAYTDYVEMVRTEQLDGVLLATWPNQHREQIANCLAAGVRNILCEKALCLTGQEATEIWNLVRQYGVIVMEGFMFRHHPAIRRLERELAAGELGPVDSVRADFSAFDAEAAAAADANRNWRQRKECGGGIPYDFACYCVNACGHFAGAVSRRVYCRGGISPVYDTINRMHALIEYDNGCVGYVESSKKADLSQRLEIVCAHGRLVLPISWTVYGEAEIQDQRSSGWVEYRQTSHAVPRADAYQLQLENFAAVIRDGARPVMPLLESVVNAFTMEALVTSLQETRPVEIRLPQEIADAISKERGV